MSDDQVKIGIAVRHWGSDKFIAFHLSKTGTRPPNTIREVMRCIWNYDIFLERIPFLKVVVLVNVIANAVVWYLIRR